MRKNVRKICSGCLLAAVLFLLISMISPVQVDAAQEVWDGSIAEGFASGSGTQNDPYIIKTAAQLAYLASSTNAGNTYEGKYIKLANDIVLNDETFTFDSDAGLVKITDGVHTSYSGSYVKGDKSGLNTVFDTTASEANKWYDPVTCREINSSYVGQINTWEPIGGYNTKFQGNFDGCGFSISGLYFKFTTTYLGLFGMAKNAVIANVNLENSYIRGDSRCGGIVGVIYSGTVTNCTNGAIVCCEQGWIGGIAGICSDGDATISFCRNVGVVSQKTCQEGSIGGIVGSADSDGIIENCYNSGIVAGTYYGTGGIVGSSSGTKIADCFNTGPVFGWQWVGGVAGSVSVSSNSTVLVENCYNIGYVNGETYVGSLAGRFYKSNGNDAAYASGCYYSADNAVGGVGTSLTQLQMKQKSSYEGFNFTSVWEIGVTNGYDYPTLRGLAFECRLHVYDNACDTSCRTCGHTRSVQHSFSEDWTFNGTDHWRACTVCSAVTDQAAHTYDNGCDTNCNICGYVREASHSYETEWSSDSAYHWHICTVCGAQADKAAHTPGADATEDTPQCCTVCLYVIQPAIGHVHDYRAQWDSDDQNHWHGCSGCQDKIDVGTHVYDSVCDNQCNTCGYTRTAPHQYKAAWSSNQTQHWHECVLCGQKTDMEDHTPGAEATETTPQTCTVCNYMIAPVLGHEHDFTGPWQWDETGHWHVCQCGGTGDENSHTWDDGVIEGQLKTYTCTVCGAVRSEQLEQEATEPSQVPEDPTEPTLPPEPTTAPSADRNEDKTDGTGWIWIVVAVTLVVLVLFLILFKKKKESKEKT